METPLSDRDLTCSCWSEMFSIEWRLGESFSSTVLYVASAGNLSINTWQIESETGQCSPEMSVSCTNCSNQVLFDAAFSFQTQSLLTMESKFWLAAFVNSEVFLHYLTRGCNLLGLLYRI
ncbi:unnamed protein product [Calypogeia fissa]